MATKIGTIYTDFTANTVGFEQGVGRVKNKGNALKGDLSKLAGAASTVFAGFSAALAIKGMIDAGEAARKYQGQLSLVVNESVGVTKAQQDLFASAQTTRTQMSDNVNLYARLARSTEELGVSHERLVGVTETLNKAGIVSAATTIEQSNALRQLSQGLAAGALRGEELNSVMENTPRIARAIADGMGLTIGQLREFGKAGKLTSEAIIKAIESQASVVDKEFKKMPVTIDQAMTQFRNSLDNALASFNGVNGAIVSVIQSGTDFIKFLQDAGKLVASELQIFNSLGYALISVGDSLLAINAAITLNTEGWKFWSAQANKHVNDSIAAFKAWGVVVDDTLDKTSGLQRTVDWSGIFGDEDPTKQISYLADLEKAIRDNYSTIEAANDTILRQNALWQSGIISVEGYTEQMRALGESYDRLEDRTPDQQARLDRLIAQEEAIRANQSATENATDAIIRWGAALDAGIMSEEAYLENVSRTIDGITKKDITESNKRIRQAEMERQAKINFARSSLFAISEIAEATGRKSFNFIKKLKAAEALINAYTAASSAASQSGIAAVGTYIATLGYVLQAYNAINSTSIDGGAGGSVGSVGGTVPAQTLPDRQAPVDYSKSGSDKVTFILIGGSGSASEITEEMAEQYLNYVQNEVNNNGRKIFERDSAQALEILKALNG